MGQDPAGAAPAAAAPKKRRKKGAVKLTKRRKLKGWKTVTSTKKIVKEPRPTRFSDKPYPIDLLKKSLLDISDDPCFNKE